MHVDICIQDNKHVWNQTTIIHMSSSHWTFLTAYWARFFPSSLFPQYFFNNWIKIHWGWPLSEGQVGIRILKRIFYVAISIEEYRYSHIFFLIHMWNTWYKYRLSLFLYCVLCHMLNTRTYFKGGCKHCLKT